METWTNKHRSLGNLVSFAAVIRVVTQHDNMWSRCVTTVIKAAKETMGNYI